MSRVSLDLTDMEKKLLHHLGGSLKGGLEHLIHKAMKEVNWNEQKECANPLYNLVTRFLLFYEEEYLGEEVCTLKDFYDLFEAEGYAIISKQRVKKILIEMGFHIRSAGGNIIKIYGLTNIREKLNE